MNPLLLLGWLWALPFSLLGGLVALLTLSKPYTTRGPAVVCRMSPLLLWFFPKDFHVAAFTWGCFVFTRRELVDRDPLHMHVIRYVSVTEPTLVGWSPVAHADKRLVRHELEHVYQAMRWGPLFPFLYLGSMLVAKLQGKRSYADCWFEVQARKAER